MREKNRKSRIFLFVVCVMVSVFCVFPVRASAQSVYDQAALFTPEQIQQLETKIAEQEERIAYDVVIVTTNDAEGKSSMEYADDFYDAHGFGTGEKKSGVLLLLDMDNREIWISTCGDMIDILTDRRIESVLDAVYPNMAQQNYENAAEQFLEKTESFVRQGVEKGQYRFDTEQKRKKMTVPQALGIGFGTGAVLSGIASLVIVLRYRGKRGSEEYAYRQNADMRIIRREDRFLNRTVVHRRIPKETYDGGSSSHGQSSVHHSDSGQTHGGGGRKF